MDQPPSQAVGRPPRAALVLAGLAGSNGPASAEVPSSAVSSPAATMPQAPVRTRALAMPKGAGPHEQPARSSGGEVPSSVLAITEPGGGGRSSAASVLRHWIM